MDGTMDNYTELLLERTRRKREQLEQKLSLQESNNTSNNDNIDEVVAGKLGTPCRKRSSGNRKNQVEEPELVKDDSPNKRQCIDDQYNKTENKENDSSTSLASARKSRFDALAKTIEGYEDDTSHSNSSSNENIPSKPPRLSLGGNKTPRKMPANHVPLKSMVTPTPKTHITVKLDKTQLSHIKNAELQKITSGKPPASERLASDINLEEIRESVAHNKVGKAATPKHQRSEVVVEVQTPLSAMRACWERKIVDEQIIRSTPQFPMKAQTPMNKQSKPAPQKKIIHEVPQDIVIKSPNKVGKAMKSLQQCLQQSSTSWKTNSIAANEKKQRNADLHALQNRGAGGLLAGTTPAPPVLPTDTDLNCATPTNNKRSIGSEEKAVVRNKVINDFESNLMTMGHYETDGRGSKVTLDLTPQSRRDKEAAAATASFIASSSAKEAASAPRLAANVQTNQVVTTTFNKHQINKQILTPGVQLQNNSSYAGAGSTAREVLQRCDDSFDSTDNSFNEEPLPSAHKPNTQYQNNAMNGSMNSLTSDSQSYDSRNSKSYTANTNTTTEEEGQTSLSSTSDSYTDANDSQINNMLDECFSDIDDESSEFESQYEGKPPGAMSIQHTTKVTFAEGHDSVYDTDTTDVTTDMTTDSYDTEVTESELDQSVVYSISKYRNAKPIVQIIRPSEHHNQLQQQQQQQRESEDVYATVQNNEQSTKLRLRELHELVSREQSVIIQTSNALNQCCGETSAFAGSSEAIECHRLLLTSCKKREAFLTEMQQLKERCQRSSATIDNGEISPSGTLTIGGISLPLKHDFMAKMGTNRDTAIHYFLVMIRQGTHLIFSQMTSTHDSTASKSLEFPNMIKLNDISQDFRIQMHVYSMMVTREQISDVSSKKKKVGTISKKKGKSSKYESAGKQDGLVIRSTNFHEVACLPLTMNALGKSHFALDRVPMSSPLQGSAHLRLTCVMRDTVEERGFLTMFDEVAGYGAWHRRWCILKNGRICFWKYPNDEFIKQPIGTIILKNCTTNKVDLIPRDICARPHTFELRSISEKQNTDRESLTTTMMPSSNGDLCSTRHWLSADTKPDRLIWCDKLNACLRNIRTWNVNARRPVRRN